MDPPNGAVLDEIQRAPELLSYIQPLIDERQVTGQYILTGSQQFEVSHTVNQSLAGRTALVRLLPFSIPEIQTAFDLPDLMRALGDRLKLVEPWGPDMQPVPAARARQALAACGLPPGLLSSARG